MLEKVLEKVLQCEEKVVGGTNAAARFFSTSVGWTVMDWPLSMLPVSASALGTDVLLANSM